MLKGKHLGDESPHRPPQHTHTLELKRLDHSRGVVRELADIEWNSIICGSANAAIIEEDQLVGRRQPFDERGIPVGTGCGQPIEDQQRSPAPAPTVSEPPPTDRDRPYWVTGHLRPSKAILRTSSSHATSFVAQQIRHVFR